MSSYSPSRSRPPTGKLVVLAGSHSGQAFLIQPESRVVLGSDPSCNIPLQDQRVAPRQLAIAGHDGHFRLESLSSGVQVNGREVNRRDLSAGDQISAGNLHLRFDVVSEAPPAPSPESGSVQLVEDGGVLVQPQLEFRISDEELSFRAAERANSQLQAIYEVGALLSAETNRERILGGIVEKAMEVLAATRGFLILRNEETGELEPAAVRVPEDEQKSGVMALSRTVLDHTILEGKSSLLRDALSDLRMQSSGGSIFRHRIRSAVCVPVQSKSQILGALYVDNTDSAGAFNQEDLHLLTAMGRMAGLALERALLIERQDRLFYGVIQALVSTLEAKDEYTRGHTDRVTRYALAIAAEMGVDEQQLKTLRMAGLLHDIGKIGVPEAILTKPGKLTPEEMTWMRRHPDIGADIVKNIQEIGEVVDIVRYHQERWDGTGYPAGLKGEEIPFLDRILAVADAYDAMTSSRAYRRNFSEEEVFAEFRRCSGQQFDPQAVEAFFAAYRKGALVLA